MCAAAASLGRVLRGQIMVVQRMLQAVGPTASSLLGRRLENWQPWQSRAGLTWPRKALHSRGRLCPWLRCRSAHMRPPNSAGEVVEQSRFTPAHSKDRPYGTVSDNDEYMLAVESVRSRVRVRVMVMVDDRVRVRSKSKSGLRLELGLGPVVPHNAPRWFTGGPRRLCGRPAVEQRWCSLNFELAW